MRYFIVTIALATTLAGCETLKELVGTEGPILKEPPAKCVTSVKGADGKVVKTTNQLCYDAAESLAQGNALVTAVDRVVLRYVQEGTWSHAQAQPYYNQTAKLGSTLGEIGAVYEANGFAEALTRANAVQQLIKLLRKEVGAQARK